MGCCGCSRLCSCCGAAPPPEAERVFVAHPGEYQKRIGTGGAGSYDNCDPEVIATEESIYVGGCFGFSVIPLKDIDEIGSKYGITVIRVMNYYYTFSLAQGHYDKILELMSNKGIASKATLDIPDRYFVIKKS